MKVSAELGVDASALKVFVYRQTKSGARKCAKCGKHLPEKAGANQRFCSIKNAKTHGKKSILTSMGTTSGLFTPVHPAEDSSFRTTRIHNTVPEIAIVPQSEKCAQHDRGKGFSRIPHCVPVFRASLSAEGIAKAETTPSAHGDSKHPVKVFDADHNIWALDYPLAPCPTRTATGCASVSRTAR